MRLVQADGLEESCARDCARSAVVVIVDQSADLVQQPGELEPGQPLRLEPDQTVPTGIGQSMVDRSGPGTQRRVSGERIVARRSTTIDLVDRFTARRSRTRLAASASRVQGHRRGHRSMTTQSKAAYTVIVAVDAS